MPYGSVLHKPPTNSLPAKQESYQKAYLLTKNTEEFSGKTSQENGPVQKTKQNNEEDKTEKATGVGRSTREETVKWNQMTVMRFQTGRGGGHLTTPTPFLGCGECYEAKQPSFWVL